MKVKLFLLFARSHFHQVCDQRAACCAEVPLLWAVITCRVAFGVSYLMYIFSGRGEGRGEIKPVGKSGWLVLWRTKQYNYKSLPFGIAWPQKHWSSGNGGEGGGSPWVCPKFPNRVRKWWMCSCHTRARLDRAPWARQRLSPCALLCKEAELSLQNLFGTWTNPELSLFPPLTSQRKCLSLPEVRCIVRGKFLFPGVSFCAT